MKIKGKLTFQCENTGELVSILARSLSPDNITGIRTEVDNDSATITFSSDKIGTILASIDDYLMNANIVEKLSYSLKHEMPQPNISMVFLVIMVFWFYHFLCLFILVFRINYLIF